MWISKKKYERKLWDTKFESMEKVREANQDEKLWELEEDVKKLKKQVSKLKEQIKNGY